MISSTRDILFLLRDAVFLSSIILVVVLLFLMFKKGAKHRLWILIYFVAMICLEYVSAYLTDHYGNNLICIHINAVLEFLIITLYFREYLKQYDLRFKFTIYWILGVILMLVLSAVSFNRVELSMSFVSLTILSYCFYGYYQMLDTSVSGFANLHLKFITGLFLMHSISLIVILFKSPMDELNTTYAIFVYCLRAAAILIARLIILEAVVRALFTKKSTLKLT